MTPVTQALSTALLHFIWQGIAGGIVLAIALLLLRKSSASSRYVASCLVLAVLSLSPVVTGWIAYQSSPVPSAVPAIAAGVKSGEAAVVAAAAESAASALPVNFEAWVLPLWAAGVIAFALRLAWASGHASSLRRDGVAADASIQLMIQNLAERAGIRRTIRVLMSSLAEVPSVVGWMRPVVLLPAAVVVGLTPHQLEALIAHELAHVRRHDYFVNILQMVVETLLFYHPVVWWVSARIRYERELCCDDLAVRSCGDVMSYARALAQLERLRAAGPTLAMGSASGPLLHRIQRLLGRGRVEYGPSKLMCGVGLVIGILTLGFFMSNARAQQEPVPLVQVVPPMPPIQPLPAPTVLPVPAPTVRPVAPAPPAPPAPLLSSAQPTIVPPVLQIPSPALLPLPAPPMASAQPTVLPPVLQIPSPAPLPLAAPMALLIELQELKLAEGVGWVLFKGNDVIVHANSDDEAEARRARRSFSGDLLWFKLDGKAYVSQDRETMNRVETASSSVVALESTIKQLAISRRIENGQEEMVMAQRRALRDAQFNLQELSERLRNLDGNAANLQNLNEARARVAVQNARLQAMLAETEALVANLQSLNDVRARAEVVAAQNAKLQAMRAETEALVRKMETQIQELELAKRNAELESRRDLDVLRYAISSGKAQPAP